MADDISLAQPAAEVIAQSELGQQIGELVSIYGQQVTVEFNLVQGVYHVANIAGAKIGWINGDATKAHIGSYDEYTLSAVGQSVASGAGEIFEAIETEGLNAQALFDLKAFEAAAQPETGAALETTTEAQTETQGEDPGDGGATTVEADALQPDGAEAAAPEKPADESPTAGDLTLMHLCDALRRRTVTSASFTTADGLSVSWKA